MRKKLALVLIPVIFLFVVLNMTNCGSGSSPSAQTGYLQGGFLSGVKYQCGINSGYTDSFGAFTYNTGNTCEFMFGGNHLTASWNDLQDGVVTPYEITETKASAWTLMSLLYSIAHGIPDTDAFVILDSKLLTLIPEVDLAGGDSAVSEALTVFPNRELPDYRVTVAEARVRLAGQVKENGTLTQSMSVKLAEGQAALDAVAISVGLDKRTNSDYVSADISKNLGETDHQNVVQFVLFDGYGCNNYNYLAGNVTTASNLPSGYDWLSVTSGQNPDLNVPQISPQYTVGNCTPDTQCFGIMWDVGRQTSTDVGTAFGQYLDYSPTTPVSSPMTLPAAYVTQADPNGTSSNLPNTLNLAMYMNLYLMLSDQNGDVHYFVCPNWIVAQGSNPNSPSQWLQFTKQIAETGYAGFKVINGINPIQDNLQFVNDFVGLYNDIMKLVDNNWWMAAVSAQTENYYIQPQWETENAAYWWGPAILTQCSHSNYGYGVNAVTVPVLISDNYYIVNDTLARAIFDIYLPNASPATPTEIQSLNLYPPSQACNSD